MAIFGNHYMLKVGWQDDDGAGGWWWHRIKRTVYAYSSKRGLKAGSMIVLFFVIFSKFFEILFINHTVTKLEALIWKLHLSIICGRNRTWKSASNNLSDQKFELADHYQPVIYFYIFFNIIPDTAQVYRIVVSLDLTQQEFFQTLRNITTDMPQSFELCRVNGKGEVIPLAEQRPFDIHNRKALQRSNLYIRPKVCR